MNLTRNAEYQLDVALRIVRETFWDEDRRLAANLMIASAPPQTRLALAQDLCDAMAQKQNPRHAGHEEMLRATRLRFHDHLRALKERLGARRRLGSGAAALPIIQEDET